VISINSLTVSFGGFTLLDDISLHIGKRERIALVGRNGAGKSTLLKLICGLQHPTSGCVSVPSECRIGYLPQIMEHHRGRTVLQEAMTAFDDIDKDQKEIDRICAELSLRDDYQSCEYHNLMLCLNNLSDSVALRRSDMPEVRARKILRGLGFREDELSRPTETFSQGWNMRIDLSKILLGCPDVLLMDEPTNHLDIESIAWLENYLKDSPSSLVLISHDRKFLDTVTNRTVEIMLGHIHDYKVPYTKYMELRAERMQQQMAAFQNQQKMIQKTQEFIERFRYKATKSNQVQSRVKALEKLDRIELDVEDRSSLNVKFPPAPRSGDIAFKAVGLSAGYPGKTVFRDADIEIKRGEKVAFVGRNGEGKTTLMRVIMKELEPLEGTASLGHNVSVGYYQQNQEDVLDKSNTVFGTLDDIAVGEVRTKLRDLLAAFLFKGEDIDKKVGVLSGGERARLAMAKLMLRPYNLLALDEPTNHMDIRGKDVLKQALQAYDGTLVVVSHDRDFLDGLVGKVYEFRDGRVREHLGGIEDYLRRCSLESLDQLNIKAPQQEAPAPDERVKTGEQKAAIPKANFISKEQRKLQGQISRLEEQIASKEAQLKAIEDELTSPSEQADIMKLTQKYLDCKQQVDSLTGEWEELMIKFEQ